MRLLKQIKKSLYSYFVLRKRFVYISPLAYYDNNCHFENHVSIDRFCNLHESKINSFSYIGYGSSITNAVIGKFCSIGSDTKIGLWKHPINYVSTSPVFYSNDNALNTNFANNTDYLVSEKVLIGNDVWIGSNSIIMGGITIGDGVVIGAGSIVTKNVENYAVVAGVPAKTIKYRFSKEQIIKLRNVSWWDHDIGHIVKNINAMNNIDLFLKYVKDKDSK